MRWGDTHLFEPLSKPRLFDAISIRLFAGWYSYFLLWIGAGFASAGPETWPDEAAAAPRRAKFDTVWITSESHCAVPCEREASPHAWVGPPCSAWTEPESTRPGCGGAGSIPKREPRGPIRQPCWSSAGPFPIRNYRCPCKTMSNSLPFKKPILRGRLLRPSVPIRR